VVWDTQTAVKLGHFKRRLREKERELLLETKRFEEDARVAGEPEVRDPTDDATVSEGTSEALEEETLASQTLTQVRDALQRIEDGTYGKCTACGRQIEPASPGSSALGRLLPGGPGEAGQSGAVQQGGSTL